jgi:hypothetical protein
VAAFKLRSIGANLTEPPLLRLVGAGFILAWLVAFVVDDVATPGLVNQRGAAIGSDFIAFYAAGRLVLQGEGRSIYEPELQLEAQQAILDPQRQLCAKLRGTTYDLGLCYIDDPWCSLQQQFR